MKRIAIAISVVLVCAASGAAGYWFGFRDAYPLGLMADAAPRGMLAIRYLNALDAGKTDRLRTAFEFDIDNGLIWSHYLSEAPFHDHWQALWGVPNLEASGYLPRLADYRRSHPSLMKSEALADAPPNASAEEWAFREFQKSGARESVAIINYMVSR